MQLGTHEIAHVSDTALMTAACRAMETQRPHGLIRDPFAGLRLLSYASREDLKFAEERILAMFRKLPAGQMPEPLPADDPSGIHLFGRHSG
jgi:O-methyltransferase involved in polyketide biosynthesis